jgi:hyperosmotically inducible periplasmic protein
MKTFKKTLVAFAAALLLIAPAAAYAKTGDKVSYSGPQLAKRVRHELVMLPYYGVFDNLAYRINGSRVELFGQVVRPSTRSGAERVVKRIPGVTNVVNNIKVLPLSSFDDQIRVATYRSLANMGGLHRYLRGANPSLHIVVDRGHVTLEGVVSSKGDRDLANMAARRVFGAFSVTNNLRINGEDELP